MNGEEGRGSCQSVYKEREGKSLMWNPQQANTNRGAETKRNTFNFFFFLTTFWHRPLWIICWKKPSKGGPKENSHLHNLFSIFPPFIFLFYFFSPFSLGEHGLLSGIIMLNNMDLNAKDSFYPQFENCNSSSLGMENSVRKDNQEVYVDAERGVPAQFGHGEFASFFCLSFFLLHGRWKKHACRKNFTEKMC